MTINVHSLMHLPDAVRNLGPLWVHSCFSFESANGEILKFFHGSQSVEKQVRNSKSSHILQMITFVHTFRLSITLVQYTNSQLLHMRHWYLVPSKPRCTQKWAAGQEVEEAKGTKLPHNSVVQGGVTLCNARTTPPTDGRMQGYYRLSLSINREDYTVSGAPYSGLLSQKEFEMCNNMGFTTPSSEVLFYPQLTLPSSIVTAATSARTTKRNNSCIIFCNEQREVCLGLVETIFSFMHTTGQPDYYCLVSLLVPSPTQACMDTITNTRLNDHLIACIPRY